MINNVLLWTPTHGHTSIGWPAKTYNHKLSADAGCCQEHLPRAINDRDGWWERVKGVHAAGMPWWL